MNIRFNLADGMFPTFFGFIQGAIYEKNGGQGGLETF